jgi:hypothetical protein
MSGIGAAGTTTEMIDDAGPRSARKAINKRGKREPMDAFVFALPSE